MQNRFRLNVGLIALGALAWRVGYVLVDHRHDGYFGDAWGYHRGGALLADGYGFLDPLRYDLTGLEVPSAIHPPLYSMYLAIPSLFGFDGPLAHRLASCLLGATTVVVLAYVARHVAGDRAGIAAAFIAAVYANLWLGDAFLLSESMAALTIAVSLLTVERYRERPDLARAAQMTAAFSLAALARAEMVLLFPFLALPILLFVGETSAKDRLQRLVAGGVAALILLGPWVAYNMSRFEEPVTISNGLGSTLLGGACDHAFYGEKLGYWSERCPTVEFREPPPGLVTQEEKQAYLREYVSMEPDESERDVASREKAFDYISEHKRRYVVVVAARVGRIWNVFRPAQNARFDADIEGRGFWEAWTALLSYYVLMGMAIAGLVKMKRNGRPIWTYLVLAGIVTFTAAITFGIQRYRLPVDVALPVLAAALFGAIRPLQGRLGSDHE